MNKPFNTAEVLEHADRPKHLRLPAHDARAALRSDWGRASRAGREAADLSQSELAEELGVTKAYVGRSEIAGTRTVPSVLHVAAAPLAAREWAKAAITFQASRHRLTVVEQPADRHGDDHGARLAAIVTDCTDLPRVLASAGADRVFTFAELVEIEREARETMEAAGEVQAWSAAELARRRAGGA